VLFVLSRDSSLFSRPDHPCHAFALAHIHLSHPLHALQCCRPCPTAPPSSCPPTPSPASDRSTAPCLAAPSPISAHPALVLYALQHCHLRLVAHHPPTSSSPSSLDKSHASSRRRPGGLTEGRTPGYQWWKRHGERPEEEQVWVARPIGGLGACERGRIEDVKEDTVKILHWRYCCFLFVFSIQVLDTYLISSGSNLGHLR
jgi:hypothetical protein